MGDETDGKAVQMLLAQLIVAENGSALNGAITIPKQTLPASVYDAAIAAANRLAAKPAEWQMIETCPKADYKSYYLFNEFWEDGWSSVQRANWFDGVWIFDSGLTLTDCETKFNPVMWHPDTTPKPPALSPTEAPKP